MSANTLSDRSGVSRELPEATRRILEKVIEAVAHALCPVTGSAICQYKDSIGCKPVIETMLEEAIY